MQKCIASRKYAPKNFPRGLSPSAAWRARTVPVGGNTAHRVNSGFAEALSLSSPYTVSAFRCVLKCRKVLPIIPPSLLLSLTCFESPPLTKLHIAAWMRTAQKKNLHMAHALYISPQTPLFFSQSPTLRNLSVGKIVARGQCERRAEQAITKQASL